jgi:hypothetical protein
VTPLDVVPYMGAIVGVGILVDSAEVLTNRRALDVRGLFNWNVLGVGRAYLVTGPLARPLGQLFQFPSVLVLPWIQVAAALGLFAAPFLPVEPQRLMIALAALTAATARMLFYMRQQLGLDGADQMFTIVLLSCGLGAVLGDSVAGYAAASYAGLQLLLSYWVAGFAKIISPTWRTGSAIIGITATIGYGEPRMHHVLTCHRWAALSLCWAVIVFECGAPFLVLGGTPGALLLAAIGLGFHLGTAVVMGLNTFVWAFGACYPSVTLIADQLSRFIH